MSHVLCWWHQLDNYDAKSEIDHIYGIFTAGLVRSVEYITLEGYQTSEKCVDHYYCDAPITWTHSWDVCVHINRKILAVQNKSVRKFRHSLHRTLPSWQKDSLVLVITGMEWHYGVLNRAPLLIQPWYCHDMETLPILLALCDRNLVITCGFP